MIVNAAIQIVPLTHITGALPVIDQAIALIQKSGIKHTVGPFETTLEGEYEAVQSLLKQLTDFCYGHPNLQFLVYSKLHLSGGQHILAEEKTAKFNQ